MKKHQKIQLVWSPEVKMENKTYFSASPKP